jgi:small GTP-binding protein
VGIFDRLDRLADQLGELIVPDEVRAPGELAAAYLDRGDLDSAAHELERAVELRPDHPRALYLLGLTHARRGDDELAIAALGKAAAVRDGFAEAHVALGEVYRQRGETDAAAGSFRAALDAGVSDGQTRGEIYRGLGAVYLAEGRVDKAVRELRKAAASLPEDAESQALLGRALVMRGGRGDLDGARLCLERAADAKTPDGRALVALGDVYARLGRGGDAEKALARAAASGEREAEVGARLKLAHLAREAGDLPRAHAEVMRALEKAPDRADALVEHGRVLAQSASPDEALAAYDRALVTASSGGAPSGASGRGARMLFDARPVLAEALAVALRAGLIARAAVYAESLVGPVPLASAAPDAGAGTDARAGEQRAGSAPAAADAFAALSRAAAAASEVERAQALAERALAAADTVDARLAAADAFALRGQTALAASSLRRATQLDPRDARPRARLAELYRTERDAIPRDLYAVLKAAHRHFARTRELAELSPEAGRLVETIDRPLLVTVMGEFNSGKSTFVNALLGEEVAPMGITPTTATINVLKYGAERKGRVVYLDETSRDVPWNDVPGLLRGLDAAEARRIRVVEVLYPLETLQRVNVVDTPGLNSIHPEHEETAQRFIAEADAVVWLFTVDQAAKATEGAALSKIRAEGKKVLGVLNKIDRCTPDELEKIVAHVRESLGKWLETVVPFAAREALKARRSSDAEQLARSNYAALEQTLEERFFSRARAIQREAARTRLGALLERAQAAGTRLLDDEKLRAVETALAQVRADQLLFARDFLASERGRLSQSADEVYTMCAREVLDFARPRRWVFGSNQAAPADRDFLLGLLDERLGALLDASRARINGEIERSLGAVRAVTTVDASLELRLLDEQVYGRFRAFARGYLRGGRVDDFFTRVLPKLELSERELKRALGSVAPYTDEIAETELRAPLAAWAERFFAQLVQRLERARATAELERFDLEERLLAPLEVLRSALEGT